MDDYEDSDANFQAVFSFKPDIAFDQHTIDRILRHRGELGNELFVDRLLKSLGIGKASKQYPPRSNDGLKNLHHLIVSSASPDHHKQSLMYYILKDLLHSSSPAEEFSKAVYLPEKYRIFIDGIWCLDRKEFERALDYLTEPALIPTFPEEILYTLCRHASENDVTLPLAYFHVVSPCITSSKVLEELFSIVCRSSVTEAFYFSRGRGNLSHRNWFEKLLNFVLANSSGAIRATRSVELINLPLDEEEEAWFEEYLKDGKGKTLFGANDTLVMRALVTGSSNAIMEYGKNMSGRKIDGVNWATLRDSVQRCSTLKDTSMATFTP